MARRVSEILPFTAKMVDDLAVIKTVHTEAINHDPAITYIQTGSQLPGRPSTGAWMSYGLGSMNQNLPAFVVLHSTVNGNFGGQALYSRLVGERAFCQLDIRVSASGRLATPCYICRIQTACQQPCGAGCWTN